MIPKKIWFRLANSYIDKEDLSIRLEALFRVTATVCICLQLKENLEVCTPSVIDCFSALPALLPLDIRIFVSLSPHMPEILGQNHTCVNSGVSSLKLEACKCQGLRLRARHLV